MSVFNVLAARHKHLSQLWFTIATAILLGGLAYATFHVMELSCSGDYGGVKQGQHGSEVSLLALPSHALPNLFLYSIFFVAWGWALKNYRAHWHNFVTNGHRFASLLAIDRIRRDADADIRRELDIQAAVVLLVPSESAYLEAEGEKEITAGERLLRVEETIRGLATHGKRRARRHEPVRLPRRPAKSASAGRGLTLKQMTGAGTGTRLGGSPVIGRNPRQKMPTVLLMPS